MNASPPIVLSLSGHDPTGGAGIQADIETLARFGCHPATVATCLTVQDSVDVARLSPQSAADFLEQAETLLRDLKVAAIKIGLLGSAEIALVVDGLLAAYPGVPVVLDPVLAAGGGRTLAGDSLIDILRCRLLPRATVSTPNTLEARKLSGQNDPDACARTLLDLGCPAVLLTGAHEDGPEVVNRLYRAAGVASWHWPRLPYSYHGSGCTLASAVAALLALGRDIEAAAAEAQQFTWQALHHGFKLGRGQHFPNRFFIEKPTP
jgi:hydroxymethylpyrimidine/phosphomethylpyrimidine kinase